MRPYQYSLAFLAAVVGLSGSAHAADSRIVTRRYDPSAVVMLTGRVGTQATIAFGDDERIENVAVGDSAMWQVTPNKRANLLFVKPTAPRARTNMTVVTDQRTYLFDLVANAVSAPVYVLRFSYPQKPKPLEPVAVAAVEPAPKPVQPDPAHTYYAWKSEGSQAVLPTSVFDDGKAVYLGWREDMAMPAILTRDVRGMEGPVNYSVQGDYVVVDGIPAQLVLRSGKEMATLTPQVRPPVVTAAASNSQASAR
jgi:type IV secretion system protein VirB9